MSMIDAEIREAFEAGMAYEEERQLNRFLRISPKEAYEMFINKPNEFILKFGERDAT